MCAHFLMIPKSKQTVEAQSWDCLPYLHPGVPRSALRTLTPLHSQVKPGVSTLPRKCKVKPSVSQERTLRILSLRKLRQEDRKIGARLRTYSKSLSQKNQSKRSPVKMISYSSEELTQLSPTGQHNCYTCSMLIAHATDPIRDVFIPIGPQA